jgi:nicotinate-nucleotide adenylyltransferase
MLNLEACNEFKLPKPSYTFDAVNYLKAKYPHHEFAIIMGSDNYQNIYKWKNGKELINDNKIIVHKRQGFEIEKTCPSLIILNEPLLEISSTAIRTMIRQGKSIRYLVSDKVREEIEENGYFMSK